MGHVLLAFNQRTAVQPVLATKGMLVNPTFLAWIASVFVLGVLVGCISGLDKALALTVLEARDWGVAVGICFLTTCWIELVKLVIYYSKARVQ